MCYSTNTDSKPESLSLCNHIQMYAKEAFRVVLEYAALCNLITR